MNEPAGSTCYEIRVRGLLGETLLGAFPGLHGRSHGTETVLTGPLADQSALYGVLAQLEALGLELLELRRTRLPDEGVDMTTTENEVAVRAVREIFAAIDSGDVDALGRQVTDDMRFQFGNAEVITGRSAFEEKRTRRPERRSTRMNHRVDRKVPATTPPMVTAVVSTRHLDQLDGQTCGRSPRRPGAVR
jgi:ketosteroid isomerase-like protein